MEEAVATAPICVAVSNIIDQDRQRRDYKDVQALAQSIKRYGVIQPIVLQSTTNGPCLVAGGRRLAALRLLKVNTLEHGRHYVWRGEDDSAPDFALRLQSVELEENLRREDLSWPEEIAAKLKLLRTMQSIHGATKGFGAGKTGVDDSGFGIRALAAMLNENPSTTSRDIDLAQYVEKHPSLAALPTKADASRKLGVAITVASMQLIAKTSVVKGSRTPDTGTQSSLATVGADVKTAHPGLSAPPVTPTDERWHLYEGKFQDSIHLVDTGSVDLVCTDLPYAIGLGDSSAAHSAGLGGFVDSDLDIHQLCADVAVASYRVLRDNRFGVFFYGMGYHQVLVDALVDAGFTCDPYPFIWLRDRTAPPDGFARYSKTYDPAIIASRGTPRFVRPNLPNSLALPSVRGPERLHAAQKPVGIMQKFIEDMTTPGCVVLDMFAGAGTTGVAALQTKRKCVLFEMEPHNCVLIRSRLGVL